MITMSTMLILVTMMTIFTMMIISAMMPILTMMKILTMMTIFTMMIITNSMPNRRSPHTSQSCKPAGEWRGGMIPGRWSRGGRSRAGDVSLF